MFLFSVMDTRILFFILSSIRQHGNGPIVEVHVTAA